MLLDFGQPCGGIVQVAYVVADIEAAQAEFAARLGIGPWSVRGPFTPTEARLRGVPTRPTVTLARGFSGHVMIELIVQHDDGPSVYHPAGEPRHYGFHHWAIMVDDLESALAEYRAAGYTEAFADTLPSGSRVVYVEGDGALPGMIELIEHTPAQERVYTEIYAAALAARIGVEPRR
jgi:catechol 2,3-dioxygenase-like lactoylglutathione lyase family enzyme